MRTSMRYDDRRPGVSDPTLNNAYLWNGRGLNAFYYEDAARNCCSGLPGLPPVNWMTLDKCSCAGVLRADVFTPDPTLIISCPIDAPQWFWMWYTDKGHPVWFMETNTDSAGTALNLADYYRFEPGVAAPPGTFEPPGFCDNACPTEAVARFPHHHASLPQGHPAVAGADAGNPWPVQCNNCHTPVNQPWVPPGKGGN
jgi:hypothetical protein